MCPCTVSNLFLGIIDKNCGVESGEGFAGHGHGGLKDFAASFQLAEIVDDFSW